ncbi:MAG: hypothetical protein KF736_11345 [Acidobacteria bacterium]|nr:hypothetical protein [Acidobacteriota bacterium]MCW5950002.1 hypothetical protein [Pyrinomonadaceae bacterium]
MRSLISIFVSLCFVLLFAVSGIAQWEPSKVDTSASFRGLSVVDQRVIWASGTGGAVIRTIDGGKKWDVIKVPGAEKLDFRDIEAFDANTAYILSIGNGISSRIYKTTNGGKTWNEQFRNQDERAFYDAIACWDRDHCMAMSDPVDGKAVFIMTKNGIGWEKLSPHEMPDAKPNEAFFAASGTCLIIPKGTIVPMAVSGGSEVRFFRGGLDSHGKIRWSISEIPIAGGSPGSGAFSIAAYDRLIVVVGGDYEKPDESVDNLALSADFGLTWKPGRGLSGYRSGVAFVDRRTLVAVGTNGTDLSTDAGKTWKRTGSENLNAVASKGRSSTWAVGPAGLVAKMQWK